MNIKKQKYLRTFTFTAILAVFVINIGFTACFSEWRGEGIITINLGGGNGRTAYPPTADILNSLIHTITLTGNGEPKTIEAKGGTVVRTTVPPGWWTIKVDAYYEEVLYATGTKGVNVTAGNNSVTIEMTKAFYDGDCDENCLAIGATGEGGGKIIYHNHTGFTVTGKGQFTARYLEAAPANMATTLAWASSGFYGTDIPGTGTAIGTGKANTAAILAVDANAPAAKACVDYRGGDKNDWFLPSQDELYEMYKARTHLGFSSGGFWSSSQAWSAYAWYLSFGNGGQANPNKASSYSVRAVRAF